MPDRKRVAATVRYQQVDSPQDELAAVEAAMRELMMQKGNGNRSP
jgi:hypothetical protein